MNTIASASAPAHSATVMASAGTGKTWLLVTRVVRLLLDGVAPDAILAVTFTRKAAAEMAARLGQRLADLGRADDTGRHALLSAMGITPNPETLRAAADLYERQLRHTRQVRFTTFHAFCQDLLRRFPLEAQVPAGFEVLDSPGLLQQEAWDAVLTEATAAPDGAIAQNLSLLFEHCNGLHNAQSALRQFLNHRSDWWAYTQTEATAVEWALRQLAAALEIDPGADPLAGALSPRAQAELRETAALLAQHGTDTALAQARAIGDALDGEADGATRLSLLKRGFLTQKDTPLARKPSKALAAKLGAAGQDRLLDLHALWAERLLAIQDQVRRHATHALTAAWLGAGTRVLEHFQRIKTEQRMLDFADLEWKAYRLLNHGDHAQWVQYKLDQRIEHVLVDEFQDTNPTQWHLLYPLLQELAAGEQERGRSVFLVGDTKQSIYRFRRADPNLFPAARAWLDAHLHAGSYGLAASWRSAPAVIDFVNQIFETGPLRDALAEFPQHSTQRAQLWGRVEVLPLVPPAEEAPASAPVTALRNPLQQPRVLQQDQRHLHEGRLLAARIQALMDADTMVGNADEARPMRYDDIMILVRQRSHLPDYEHALRAAGIPYVSANRGTLLQCAEIQDMVSLLTTLIVPYDNLALARVLRCPLFACSDEDLMALARHDEQPAWFERLREIGPGMAADSPLRRAAHWLTQWRQRADQRPVHDLLDRVYAEGNVLARFDAAFPVHLRSRVRANLTRFIELALEIDSGRYPSLSSFLHRLRGSESAEDDAPDEAPAAHAQGGVRMLTIHAAKGLEAPVVFLAGSATASRNNRAYQALVRWPTLAAAPTHFLLTGKTSELDTMSAALLAEQAREDEREQANLLYVALTRAKQMLYISGCQPQRGEELGWYGLIAAQLGDAADIANAGWRRESGTPPRAASPAAEKRHPAPEVDPRLSAIVQQRPREIEIAPSRAQHEASFDGEDDEDGRERGRAIHRFLELLCGGMPGAALEARGRVAAELGLDAKDARLADWWNEAEKIIRAPALRAWFDAAQYDAAYNEVPLQYQQGEALIHGVIDRLVLRGGRCAVIDYKTHRGAADAPQEYALRFREQLRLYAQGVARLWPGKQVEAYLLFTVNGRMELLDF